MPNTVLGKVSVVPKGDYSASTTYYALDIVGYNGGSYLAMQQVTGVTPSNDGVNWMQLSGPGLPGENGTNGVTFTPSVSDAGVISWTNDGEEENPDPVDIMGPPGAAAGFGTVTATVDESTGTPSASVETSGPDTAKNFAFSFSGLKGETGPQGIQGVQGQPGTSVSRIQRTSGTGAAGTTDTYTMYDSNDDAIGTFTVYNGTNGAGAGDFMADGSVPMTGALDMGGQRVTNVGAPTASTDAVRQSDLKAVSDEVDDIISGTTAITIPAATEAKRGGVIIGEGLSVTADGTLSADDQLPAGGTPGQVLTQGESGPEWTDAPDPLPTGGETGQVLTKTASGTAWDDVPSDLPAGGTDGQILTKTADGVAWEDAPEGGVTSFKGRTGAVTPQEGDYTADMVGARPDTWTPSAADVGAVPTSRTVNGQELSQDINLTADNVGARPSTWTPTASDVGAIPNPSGGTAGQILEKTATGTQWADKPSGGIPVVTTSGTGAAYTATVPGVTELTDGLALIILPNVSNTATNPTLNVNGLGAKNIGLYNLGGDNTSFGPTTMKQNYLTAGYAYLLIYTSNPGAWCLVGKNLISQSDIRVGLDINYTANHVRGIALQTSTPSSIPNGSIVGVYST